MNRYPKMSKEKQFLLFVEKTDGCWLWTGSIPPKGDGYGFFSVGKKSLRAHRVAYTLWVGPIPNGKLVCHSCDNRSCVNPGHLFVGTTLDNNRDRARKGRSADMRGEKSGRAKLTNQGAEEIRKLYAAGGILQRELAAKFGVSQAQISKVILRQTFNG